MGLTVVQGSNGFIGEPRTATPTLSAEAQRLARADLELDEANDKVFTMINSNQGGGAYGLLTDGEYTCEEGVCADVGIGFDPILCMNFEKVWIEDRCFTREGTWMAD